MFVMYSLLELAVSLGVLLTLVYVLAGCVCGCKNSNQKASTQNSQRSLPEIPQPVGRHDSGDTASDTYATVNLDENNKIIPIPSTSRSHEYERTIYAVPQKENVTPLEVVQEPRANGDIAIDERDASQLGPESLVISASVAISGQLPSSQELPYITPPSPRHRSENPQHFSGDSTDSAKGYTSISVRPPLSNIRATMQSKTQGSVYVSVSDDSDDTYAHIEGPAGGGSETYAQITPYEVRPVPDTRRSLDRDIRTVLMPNDARRSAPPEIGSAANATHSRQASSSSCTNSAGALGSPKPEKRQANSPLPPPPHPPPAIPVATPPHSFAQRQQRIASTGDLHFSHDKVRRSLNEKHQRNNSCVSSSDGLQTFYGCNYPVEKHRFSSGDIIRPLVAKELKFDIDSQDTNVDNLYNSIDGPGCSDYSSTDANNSINSEHRGSESPSRNVEEMYAKVIKKAKAKEEARRSKELSNALDAEVKFRVDDPGYETIDKKKINHGYETIPHKDRKNSNNQDPGYETVKDIKPNQSLTNNNILNKAHYGNDSGPNSILSSDPGYEHISKADNSASDSDPNYEVLRNQPPTPPYATITPSYKLQPTYSVVNKKSGKSDWSANNNDEATLEPNYESMPNDPVYTTGSESDPNYESVRPKDPNYECMSSRDPNYESIRRKDPKYESVRSKDSKYDSIRSREPNYESVKYLELSRKEPPYEKVNNTASGSVQRKDSASGYEKISVPKNKDSESGGTVSDYFQV